MNYVQVSLQTIFHRPFSQLSEETILARRREIRSLARRGRYKEAVREGYTFIDTVMEGVEYYQRYQQAVLYFTVLYCTGTSRPSCSSWSSSPSSAAPSPTSPSCWPRAPPRTPSWRGTAPPSAACWGWGWRGRGWRGGASSCRHTSSSTTPPRCWSGRGSATTSSPGPSPRRHGWIFFQKILILCQKWVMGNIGKIKIKID